jgi:hypothetical protein
MPPHRRSYLKTVVAALGVSAASLALAAYGLAGGRVPLTGWILFESHLLRWALAASLIVLGLVCLLVAVGGLFALSEDARAAAAGPGRTETDDGRQ